MKILVIGLGNPILTDDGIGPRLIELAINKISYKFKDVIFKESNGYGFDLIYELIDYDKVLIIDGILTNQMDAGNFCVFDIAELDKLKHERLVDSHGINLATVMDIANKHNYKIPDEIKIFGIEVLDITSFSEELSQPLNEGLQDYLDKIEEILNNWIN